MGKKTGFVTRAKYDKDLAQAHREIEALTTLIAALYIHLDRVSYIWISDIYKWAKSKYAEDPSVIIHILEGIIYVITKLDRESGMTPDEIEEKYFPKEGDESPADKAIRELGYPSEEKE